MRRVRVLLHVDERLRDDEVGGHLDRGRDALGEPDVERDRDAARGDERGERRVEPAVREDCRGDAADEAPEVGDRGLRLRVSGLDELAGRLGVAVHLFPREAEVHRHGDHARLGAVVEVALDPPQLARLRVDRCRAGAGELADPALELLRSPGRGGSGRAAPGRARDRRRSTR